MGVDHGCLLRVPAACCGLTCNTTFPLNQALTLHQNLQESQVRENKNLYILFIEQNYYSNHSSDADDNNINNNNNINSHNNIKIASYRYCQ